jgi:hypothetical protein
MTPKEKAKELVNAMGLSTSYTIKNGEKIPLYRNQYAKQCALIAVDEILSVLNGYTQDYWKEVKQELL